MVERVLVCLGLALTVFFATAATASAASYAGGGVDDERVIVSFERKHGEVRDFTVGRARFLCTDGERFRGGTQAGTMKVRRRSDGRRRFRGRFNNKDRTQVAEVDGLFPNRRRARGSFQLTVTYGDVGCFTPRIKWKARRT